MAAKICSPSSSPAETGSPHTELGNLLESYIWCARAEGKSRGTIEIRITAVLALIDFLRCSGLSTCVHEIGADELRRFILHLQGVRAYQSHPFSRPRNRGLSGHTVNGYLRSLRAFWSWLVSEEMVPSSPFNRVKIPKPPRKVVPTFSEAQLQALLGVILRSTAIGSRDWTMIVTLLDTGMRASELVGIAVDDMDLEDGTVRVRGKGDKERIVPLGATVQQALWRYLQRHRPKPRRPQCTSLFLTRDGEPVTLNRLEKRIKDYGVTAGLEGVRCSPHTFRHTFAISYLRNGGDVFSLQRILGHSTLDVVRIYVNMSDVDVKACHRRFSPADNMDLTQRSLRKRLRGDGLRWRGAPRQDLGRSRMGPEWWHGANQQYDGSAARMDVVGKAGIGRGRGWTA